MIEVPFFAKLIYEKNENYKNRLNDCSACEFFIKEKFTCDICHCYMIAKALLPNATCPLGKW